MKHLVIIALFFYTLTLKSQSVFYVSTYGIYSKKELQKDLAKEVKKAHKKNITASLHESANSDTLIYISRNSIDGYELKFAFGIKQEDDDNVYCDYQVFSFDCTPCSQKHLNEFIKSYGFRKLSGNKYLSGYSTKTEMTVLQKDGTDSCLVVEFRYVDKQKKEYKALYNSLPKNQ